MQHSLQHLSALACTHVLLTPTLYCIVLATTLVCLRWLAVSDHSCGVCPMQWLALIPFHCSPTALMVGSLLRVLFIPILLLCVSPSPAQPILHKGVIVWASILACGLGITNGYYGSVPIINISKEVKDDRHRELAGNLWTVRLWHVHSVQLSPSLHAGTMMVWFILGGLAVGSILAYALTPLTELASEHTDNSSQLNTFDTCSNST